MCFIIGTFGPVLTRSIAQYGFLTSYVVNEASLITEAEVRIYLFPFLVLNVSAERVAVDIAARVSGSCKQLVKSIVLLHNYNVLLYNVLLNSKVVRCFRTETIVPLISI